MPAIAAYHIRKMLLFLGREHICDVSSRVEADGRHVSAMRRFAQHIITNDKFLVVVVYSVQ